MPKDALTPQARHRFTRFDQVDQLVTASEADPGYVFHGADDDTVQPAPHGSRRPDTVCPVQRLLHKLQK